MSIAPKIAIIILHYKNLSDTIECLHSVFKIDYPSFETILIDNGSQDDLTVLRKTFPDLVIFRLEENQGFAEGNNRGMQLALERGADFFLLLNNDTIVAKNLLRAFANASLEHPTAAVFGAKIYYYDDPTVIWHAGGDVHPKTWRCYHKGCTDSDLDKRWENVQEISYACGCALFVRADVFKKVGGMAPEFFLLWEEIDWCWRIRRAGYQCLFVPEARLWHKISQAFDGGNRGPLWQYYYFRNRLLFIRRNFPFKKRMQFYFMRFFPELAEILWKASYPGFPKDKRRLHQHALKGILDYCFSNLHKMN